MCRSTLILCLLLGSIEGYGQRERVHLDLDKYSAHAGDTIWFKGWVYKNASPANSASSSLYVQLVAAGPGSGSVSIIKRYIFPVANGQCMGQIWLPDTLRTDNYYIIALTKQQLNYDTTDFFSVPVLVYNKDKPAPICHKRPIISDPGPVAAGVIKDITWISSCTPLGLSVVLHADSPALPHRLLLVKPAKKNAYLRSDIVLNSTSPEKQVLFTIDSAKDHEVLYLYELNGQDTLLLGRQNLSLRHTPPSIALRVDTLDTTPFGLNSWQLHLPGPTGYFTSISVTDADRTIPSPRTIDRLSDSYTDNFSIIDTLIDSSFVTLSGSTADRWGKKIDDPSLKELVVAGVRDTSLIFTTAVPVDSCGKFNLPSLFFYGNIDLQYQVNGQEYTGPKDVRLFLDKFTPPAIDSAYLAGNWEDGTSLSAADTVFTDMEQLVYEHTKIKTLQAATVKARRSLRKELDAQYTSGSFSEPALYVYDLRTDSSEYNRDIYSYLNAQGGRLRYDPISDKLSDVQGHPIHFFVDQMEYDPRSLRMFDFERLAYIKVLESSFLGGGAFGQDADTSNAPKGMSFGKSPKAGGGARVSDLAMSSMKLLDQKTPLNVCIYTRKGKDFRTMRGGLNRMLIKGYDPIVRFSNDRITLYWNPRQWGKDLTVRFRNTASARRFRLRVEGISFAGETLYYEVIIDQNTNDLAHILERELDQVKAVFSDTPESLLKKYWEK